MVLRLTQFLTFLHGREVFLERPMNSLLSLDTGVPLQHTPTCSDRLQPSSAGTKHIVYLERQIVLVPLKDCLPTEAAVGQKKIEEMVATVTAEGFFPAPVIASKHPATQQILLLDGNHRRTVGALMGLKYILQQTDC